MSLLDRVRSIFAPARSPAVADAPATIKAYDSFGRQIEVPRREWETNVLPGMLAAAHDDPDRLYDAIVLALEDGFAKALVDASARLQEIDADPERSHAVRAIVLMKSDRLDDAERVLNAYIEKHGPTGIILTNLAKVYAARNQQAASEATLWKALELDPNQENGLMWWCSIEQEKHGQEGLWQAMNKAAALPGSWRPQLWQARRALEQKDLPQARRLYEYVLAHAADEPQVLMMVSGDLGNNGHVAEIVELVLPIYDPVRHDPWTGLNLLQACLETNNLAEGETLVNRLFALNRPDLKDRLYFYANEFDKLRAAAPRVVAEPGDGISIEVVPIERPIWAYGLGDPAWLFDDAVERHDEVVFIPWANKSPGDLSGPTAQRENDLGRLTRSLPLYLLESLYFHSPLKPRLALPIVRGTGPVVVGAPWTEEQITSLADGAPYAVTGTIEQTGDELTIELAVWNCLLAQLAESFSYSTTVERFGETILHIERDLAESLAGGEMQKAPSAAYYRRPAAELVSPYLTCLGQTLMLSLVQNKVVSKDGLWGERNIIEYCLTLALNMPDYQVPKIMFTSALAKSHDYGSEIWGEFQRQSLQLVEQEQDRTSPFYRLSPVLLRLYDPELFHLRKAELLKDANGAYRAWLSALTLDGPSR